MALLSRAACWYARESAKLFVGSRNCVASLVLLVLFSGALPASAENAISQTAQQATSTGPTAPHHIFPAAGRSVGVMRPATPIKKSPSAAPDPVLYENGPVNGTVNAWQINFGFIVSDTFTLQGGGATVKDFDLWVWELPGDHVTTVEWSFTSQAGGGMVFRSGTASVFDSFISFNQFGYNIDELTVSGLQGPLQPGTFWLNLQNASVPSGDRVYRDQNNGANCGSPGCSSQASQSSIGPIPPETFDINPTMTTLAVAPPSPVVAGQVVTLTATVTTGLGPVPLGTLTFSNGKQVLGTVQLVQATGTATLKLRFGPGAYSFAAGFNGTDSFQPSQSAPQPYTVTGTEPTITTLTDQPDGNNYDFTASVFGFGFPAPTGAANFNDLTTMTSLGSAGMSPGMSTFLPQQMTMGSPNNLGVAVADFNGDGFLDLAVSQIQNTVGVLLGRGDGTFQPPKMYGVGVNPVGITVADVNGDGFADLVVTNTGDNTVSVLLGKGDGTFQPQQTYKAGAEPVSIAVADFNRDGVPDLAVANQGDNTVSVLLGKGDGTFQPQQQYVVGQVPYVIAVADFNGDGVADLVVSNAGDNTVSVLLGKGDGTFQPQLTSAVGNFPVGVAVGDFNDDGIPDLAVGNASENTVSVLLGKGDGTFQPQQQYVVGQVPYVIAVADFNGDGVPDLAVANQGDNTVSVLLGKGDGTFQPQQTYAVGAVPVAVAVADFNGDGVPDVTTANDQGNLSILLGGTVATAQLLNIPVFGVGVHKIRSTYAPNTDFYAGSLSNVVNVSGRQQGVATTTVVMSSLNPSEVNQSVTFTAKVTALDQLPTGNVTFTSNGNPIPECLNPVPVMQVGNSSVATCTTKSLAPGTDTILASFNDPQSIYSSSSATLAQIVQDFALLPISPGAITVVQGFNNTNEPFFAQAINVTVQPLFGYGGTVTLSCSVSPTLAGGACVVNHPASGSLAGGNLNTTLAISAGSSTPQGPYTVTITAQDGTGLMHFSNLALTVICYTAPIQMPPGGAGRTSVCFAGPPGTVVNNLSCPLVSGTGITGSEDLSKIGGVCTFSPVPVTLPGSVIVTISGCTVARLRTSTRILAAFWLGMPAMVLLGSARNKKLSRKRMLQLVAMFLLVLALLMGVGCGGGYGQLTPTGSYSVLVQGTSADGTVYSAVVPVQVVPLSK